jgi:hypothetical protein
MNTPRSRPLVRHTAPEMDDSPDGTYISGLHNEKMLANVGFIITVWPHIEEEVVDLFAELALIEDRTNARLLFRSIINPTIRLTIMRTMLQKSPQHHDKSQVFDELIDEYASLGKVRNTYAHGLWYTYENQDRVFIEEETATPHKFFQKREVTETEIASALARIDALSRKLMDREKQRILGERLATFPEKSSPPQSEDK